MLMFLPWKVSSLSAENTTSCRRDYDVVLYPRTLTHLSVIHLIPLKIKATFYVSYINQTFSVSGMVCPRGFNNDAARTACRSLGHSKATIIKHVEVDDDDEVCTFDYKKKHANIPCRFILNKLNCTNTTVDLMDCLFDPIFSLGCKSDQYIGLSCSTPSTTTKRTTTKKSTMKTTSTMVTTSEINVVKYRP